MNLRSADTFASYYNDLEKVKAISKQHSILDDFYRLAYAHFLRPWENGEWRFVLIRNKQCNHPPFDFPLTNAEFTFNTFLTVHRVKLQIDCGLVFQIRTNEEGNKGWFLASQHSSYRTLTGSGEYDKVLNWQEAQNLSKDCLRYGTDYFFSGRTYEQDVDTEKFRKNVVTETDWGSIIEGRWRKWNCVVRSDVEAIELIGVYDVVHIDIEAEYDYRREVGMPVDLMALRDYLSECRESPNFPEGSPEMDLQRRLVDYLIQ